MLILAILALRAEPFQPRLVMTCGVLCSIIVTAFAGEYLLVSRRLTPAVAGLEEVMSVIPQGSRILSLNYRATPSCPGWPLLERAMPESHWATGVAAARNLIVLNNYEALSRDFPLVYRQTNIGMNAGDELDLKDGSKLSAWSDMLRTNALNSDFVVLWGVPSGVACSSPPVTPPLEDALKVRYDRVVSVSEVSRAEVWKRR